MGQWAILAAGNLLFTTGDRDIARRCFGFGLEVFDHRTACFATFPLESGDAYDLLTVTDFVELP